MTFFDIFNDVINIVPFLGGLILVLGITGAFFSLFRSIGAGIKRSLRIAVVGPRRAGKTSMITVVFDHIMSGKLARFASVSGLETIDRISASLQTMTSGINLGPTKDNDVFAYRYVANRKVFGVLAEKYDVEIADFPGEYSEEVGATISDWVNSRALYKKEFFSWIVRADRYIFVVDLEEFVREQRTKNGDDRSASTYSRSMEVLFKNAVLQLKQELLDERLYQRAALLVFAKADLLLLNEAELEGIISGSRSPLLFKDSRLLEASEQLVGARNDEIASKEAFVLLEFKGLTDFIKNNFHRTEIIFHSSYLPTGRFARSNNSIVEFATPFSV